ncbi:MAG: aminotransferase class I/II-fold pyridoxal phosphate-dependent enzyme [Acidobacteria bacterium]|nr:aminotransferase class I/II-fold pyridoxal phosphate-dependent enzyme [Acidobacteriota bacterium]MBI3489449.1 aminotransferase class I/II-fold pyridoxal phosphate-dependent enzyme [Acidobacteriota bacterium]
MTHASSSHAMETQAVHAGREVLHEQGIHAMPIDLSSTYPVQDLDEGGRSLEAMAMGGLPIGSPVYSRLYNPTVARYEQALAQMEGAEECVAFGSGMAAVTASLMAAKTRGNHIVAVRPLYGGTDHLLASGMLGLEVTWADANGIAAAIRPDTAMVMVETPANPTLALLDLEDVIRQAGKVPVLVDNTFATPVLQNPIKQGATLVLHSATKFLGGHGDVLAGLVATNNDWAVELRKVRVITGNVLHPLAAYLLHRSLPTLPLRVRSQQAGAQILAERLAKHPAVSAVHFPGLAGQDPKGLLGRQMKGPGSLMAFELVGGFEAASVVMSEVKLMTPAVSLGSVDTLIQHPAALTHRVVNPDAREHSGISQSLMRLSVGLENPEDLWADLEQALVKAMARTAAHA